MYKKAQYAVGSGTFCQSRGNDDGVSVITRENGRIIRRIISLPNGKIFAARAVSYADYYFEVGGGTLEILGEEIIYDGKQNTAN